MWGRLKVIALGGCYVEMVSPYRPRTTLDVLIGARGTQLALQAQVRYSDPGVGMGLMFTDVDDARRAELERLLATIPEHARQDRSPQAPQ